MSYRHPNRSQSIFCTVCQKKTIHSIPDCDSRWTTVDDVRMYIRWRKCSDCGNNLPTCELPRNTFDKLLAELDQLRANKREFDELSEVLRQRCELDERIREIVSNRS
jgi:hypothetical protein